MALAPYVAPALEEFYETWIESDRSAIRFTEVPGAKGLKFIHQWWTREWVGRNRSHNDVTLADLQDLEAMGLLRIQWSSSSNGQGGSFGFTPDGTAYVRALKQSPDATGGPAVGGFTWGTDVLPVLQAIYEIERTLGVDGRVTPDQVNLNLGRPSGAPATGRVLRQLSESGYLTAEIQVDQVEGPIQFRLGPRALEQIAGWPSAGGGDLSAQFIAALQAIVDDPNTSEEERTKVKKALGAVKDVSQGVLTGVLAGVAKTTLGL